MMRFSFVHVVGVCSILVSIQVRILAESPDGAARDLSGAVRDPTTSVLRFYSALANADIDGASRLLLQPEKMKEWIGSQIELSAAFKRWNAVVADRLRDEGPLVMPNPIQLVADRSKDVDVQVNGDTAEFPINKKNPMKLKRVENTWKLDIFSAYERPETLKLLGVTSGEDALLLVTLKAREETSMLNAIGAEIQAGRLTTAVQVRHRIRSERDVMGEKVLRAFQKAAVQPDEREPE